MEFVKNSLTSCFLAIDFNDFEQPQSPEQLRQQTVMCIQRSLSGVDDIPSLESDASLNPYAKSLLQIGKAINLNIKSSTVLHTPFYYSHLRTDSKLFE